MCLSKDLNEIFRSHHSRCMCPPWVWTKASPKGTYQLVCYLEWCTIRYHANRAQNNKIVPPKDSTFLIIVSSSLVVDRDEIPLLLDVEGDRGLQWHSLEVRQVWSWLLGLYIVAGGWRRALNMDSGVVRRGEKQAVKSGAKGGSSSR